MRRISSSLTTYYKVILPTVWLTAFGATAVFFLSTMVVALSRGMEPPRELIFFAVLFPLGWILGFVLFCILCFPLKHVYVAGGELRIVGLKEQVEIKLTDVILVEASEWTNPEIVTLTLRRESSFGSRIKFAPGFRFWRASEHPTFLELTEFVKEANKAPEPTSTSVMPRATLPSSDLKHRTEFPNQAQAMPAVAVAHL